MKPKSKMKKTAHIKDGVAMVKFIHWLKKNVGMKEITELSAADKLYEFRSVQENFQETALILSLPTMHMEPLSITVLQKKPIFHLSQKGWF